MKKHQRFIYPVLSWVLLLLLLPAGQMLAQKVDLKTTNYPIPSSGVVVYVAPEDDNQTPGVATNTGTSPASPWTLSKALLEAPAGATVLLRGGEYRSVNQSRITNKITLQAYPGEKPWIKGSIVVTDWQPVGEVWVHAGWPYQFPRTTVKEDIGTNPLCDNRDMVFINDIALTQVDTLSKVGPGTFYVDYAGDKLYIGTDPATGRVESTRYDSPIMRKTPTGGEFRVPNGTAMKGIGFTHFADEGLEVVCAGGLLLENNTFAWNGTAGAGLVAPTAIIRGNTFAYNGKQGMGGNNLKETLVEHNISYRNNVENYSLSWSAAGIKVINSKKTRIRHNVVENNNGAGIWIDISVIDNELSYNTIKRNNGFGIFSELSNGTLIAGNLLIDNRNFGVAVADGDSSEVWNNTIVSANGKGFFIKDSPRLASSVQPGSPYYNNSREASWITRGNIIKNNLVIAPTLWMENTSPANLQVKESDFNGYYRNSANTGANVYKWNNVTYQSLAAFRAANPTYEANSLAFYGPEANPFFTDTTYQLKATSPAIKAGTPLPAKIAALLDLAPGVSVDMGARQTVAPPTGSTIAYNTGGGAFTSVSGQVYQPDNQVTGGHLYERADLAIEGTDEDALYQNERFGNFNYAIPLTNGDYEITFKFAELYWQHPGMRVFDVIVEGKEVITDLDIYAQVGATTALDILKTSTISDGTLNIEFKTNLDNAQLCGLVVKKAGTSPIGTGLSATYFNNLDLTGTSLTRTDARISFDWATAAPAASIDADTYSVRWTGQVMPAYSQTYTFYTQSDDGVRVWVNDQLLIDNWTEHQVTEDRASINLEAATKYNILVEYYENGGEAVAKLFWSSPSQPKQVIPQSWLFPATTAAAASARVAAAESVPVEVFPNPVTDQLNVKFRLEKAGPVSVGLTNALGQQHRQWVQPAKAGANQLSLGVSGLKNGVYYLTIHAAGMRRVERVVIAH